MAGFMNYTTDSHFKFKNILTCKNISFILMCFNSNFNVWFYGLNTSYSHNKLGNILMFIANY